MSKSQPAMTAPKTPLNRRKSAAPEMLLANIVNDDDKEKENLRAQNSDTPTVGGGNSFTPFKKMIDSNDNAKRKSLDSNAIVFGTPKGGNLDKDRLQSLYGDCIKLANENKITQKNAWNMNLLDHIRGLASSAETDFVTAGCTLDAAGKIYSCRVDSVHNETFRVVHGLGRVGDGQDEEDKAEGDEGADSGEEGEEGESKKKVKKAAPTRSSTIENNPDSLLQKKLDTESNVDPLFQKMCKAFDEGGARGMLLNQLSLAPGCSLLIESTAVVDDENLIAPNKLEQQPGFGQPVDVSSLKRDLFASIGASNDAGFEKHLLAASLCPTVIDFLGNDGHDEFVGDITSGPGDLSQLDPVQCVPLVAAARESFGGADSEAVMQDDGASMAGDDDDDCGGGCDDGAFDLEEQMRKEICEEEMPEGGAGVPLRGKTRARQSVTGDLDQLDMFIGVDDDYSYFSKEAARSWAGPSHWSFRKAGAKLAALARAGAENGEDGDVAEDGAVREFGNTYSKANKKGGKKKEAFFLDLTGPAPADMEKKMSTSKASITLASVKGAKESVGNTLPEDLKYSVDTLRRLFLRPRTRVTLRQANYYRSSSMFGGDDDMGQDDDDNGDCCGMEDAPDDWGPPKEPAAPETAVLLEVPRRAQKIDISYARTAKKVDIKALKDDLWEQIDRINPDVKTIAKDLPTELVSFMGENKQALPFSDTISKLDMDKCPDVSISYCFICLLHLANEKNLAILGDGQHRDSKGGSLCVGELADLRVIHDP